MCVCVRACVHRIAGGGGAFKTATGKDFHAEHSFVAAELGYSFDQLPTPPPSKALDMTEMPTFAVFPVRHY